jgi:hypothetical protein
MATTAPAPRSPWSGIRWPAWLALSALLLVLPIAVWTWSLWWPGWGVVLGLMVPDLCALPPDAANREADLIAERNAESALRRQLAELQRQIAGRRVQCRVPVALPRDRWDQRDLTMLEGCWDLISSMQIRMIETGRVRRVARWQMCFDRAGRGRHDLAYDDGTTCRGDITAQFRPDGSLGLTEPRADCADNTYIHPTESMCKRIDETLAHCERYQPQTNSRAQAQFRRRR